MFFRLFTFAINLWHRKFVTQQKPLQCLSKINMVYSDENKFLIKKHINALSIHIYMRRGIKIGALKMQFICVFFHIC